MSSSQQQPQHPPSTATTHYQSPESKKDEFRRYLEKSGAIESLTTVLVGLYEENDRPLESTDYIRRYLGNVGIGGDSLGTSVVGNGGGAAVAQQQQQENEKLKKENKELKTKIQELNKTIETLRVNLKHAREEARQSREEVRRVKAGSGDKS